MYLVTGGYDGNSGNFFSSTEILQRGSSSWTLISDSLPARMYGLRSISINNEIFLTGIKLEIFGGILGNFVTKCHSYMFCTKYSFSGGWDGLLTTDGILQFNKETNKFVEVGKLQQRRQYPSVSLVKTNDYTCA